jgi:kynurenine formamidase
VTRVAPFGFTKVVFLSHVIDDNTPVFPGDPPFEIHLATIERNGYYLQSLVAGEQAGTHWAAPAHFNFGHAAADELDPGDFFHPAVVLDVRAAAAEDADFTHRRSRPPGRTRVSPSAVTSMRAAQNRTFRTQSKCGRSSVAFAKLRLRA